MRHRELRRLLAQARARYAPPRTPEDVMAWERRVGVNLPEAYRDFITEIGDGDGPSPDGRLLTLAEAEARSAPAGQLVAPFVAPRHVDDDIGPLPPGILVITDGGSAFKSGLVVKGADRGQIWTYVEVGPGWIPEVNGLTNEDGTPFHSDDVIATYRVVLAPWNRGRRQSFIGWMQAFLQRLLATEPR